LRAVAVIIYGLVTLLFSAAVLLLGGQQLLDDMVKQ
jgi:hypothetical protein